MRPTESTRRYPVAVLSEDLADPFTARRRELDFLFRTPPRPTGEAGAATPAPPPPRDDQPLRR